MKKILFVIACVAMAMMQTSCSSPKDKLQEMVDDINAECPEDLGMLGEIASAEIEDDMVIMTIELSDEFPVDFEQMEIYNDQMKASMLSGLASSSSAKQLFEVIADADAGFVMRLARKSEGKHVDFTCSNAEIKKLVNGEIEASTPRQRLEDMAANSNVQCPQQVDEMTVMTKVAVEDDYMTYHYDVDENLIDLAMIEASIDEAKANILSSLQVDDPLMMKTRECCRASNTGMRYVYHGTTTGKEVVITIESSEM